MTPTLPGQLPLHDLWHPNHLPRGRARLARALLLLAALGGCANNGPAPLATGAPVDGGALALDTTDPKKLLAAVDALSGPLKDSQKPFEVLSALGNLLAHSLNFSNEPVPASPLLSTRWTGRSDHSP